MNILIPDSWLREYLKTNATPKQIKEYLSLCGPSVERIHKSANDFVYDIEVTTNRPDSMSVIGIAREAAAILPRFNITAKFVNNPYKTVMRAIYPESLDFAQDKRGRRRGGINSNTSFPKTESIKPLRIETDPQLNPRWSSIVLEGITVTDSPAWLQKKLIATGIRPINNIVDITNYLMRAYGQPAHAFDYDQIRPQAQIPTMRLRSAKFGEKITTLDGKEHTLPGGDIVIEDGAGRLIDLCGIMGAQNSSITSKTQTIVLFMQTYAPERIRKTSMALAIRTEAASLFEKGLDAELVLPTLLKGIELVKELAGGKVASELYDVYPKPFIPYTVQLERTKLDAYLGTQLPDSQLNEILLPLGLTPSFKNTRISVTVPSFRRDVQIDVDIIEEIARIYGYHNLASKLPDTQPPLVHPDPVLTWEEEVKVRLRDWGYTEVYTYSMISEELMHLFGFDKKNVYQISNPLSSEWIYMRPNLISSLLSTVSQNLHSRSELQIFELSNVYIYKSNNLPAEVPFLTIAWTQDQIRIAKGLAQALFSLLGIPFPTYVFEIPKSNWWHPAKYLRLGDYGQLGLIHPVLTSQLKIKMPVTILELNFTKLVANAKTEKKYLPIPKHPGVIEDVSFTFPPQTAIGPVLDRIKKIAPQIYSIELVNQYEQTSTFRVMYLDPQKVLTAAEIEKLRALLIMNVQHEFDAKIKGNF